MAVHTKRIGLQTGGEDDIVDLTRVVERVATESGIRDGLVTVFVPGSTASITTIEMERGLIRDVQEAFRRLVPRGIPYAHNHGGDSNGHAHVRAALVGPQATIPLVDGELTLGTWQQVVLVDHDDRPRSRELVVQVIGD